MRCVSLTRSPGSHLTCKETPVATAAAPTMSRPHVASFPPSTPSSTPPITRPGMQTSLESVRLAERATEDRPHPYTDSVYHPFFKRGSLWPAYLPELLGTKLGTERAPRESHHLHVDLEDYQVGRTHVINCGPSPSLNYYTHYCGIVLKRVS